MTEEDLNEDMEREIREERNRESQTTFYDDWLSDNLYNLRADFIEECFPDEFNNYCREQFNEWNNNR